MTVFTDSNLNQVALDTNKGQQLLAFFIVVRFTGIYQRSIIAMELHFEWDLLKAERNLRKHGVSFVEACDVFFDPLAIWLHDDEHSQLEDRWVAVGQVKERKLVVVVHTWKEDSNHVFVRIISARKATAHEAKTYQG